MQRYRYIHVAHRISILSKYNTSMNFRTLMSLALKSYTHHTHTAGTTRELEYILVTYRDKQIIAIRGTEVSRIKEGWFTRIKNKLDWIRDLRFIPWKIKGLPVGHAGFIRGGKSIFKDALPELKFGIPIYVTGHSLGGALAIVVSCLLYLKGYKVRCVAFGMPRVFYTKLKLPVDIKLVRNGKDLVTLLPPFGRHSSKPIAIGGCNRDWNLEDHAPEEYLKSLGE